MKMINVYWLMLIVEIWLIFEFNNEEIIFFTNGVVWNQIFKVTQYSKKMIPIQLNRCIKILLQSQ